jgi:hypothetical protein
VSHDARRQYDFTTLRNPVLGPVALAAVSSDHEGFAFKGVIT